MKLIKLAISCVILFNILLLSAIAQTNYVNLEDILPVDPDVRIGVLDNGLIYYIKHNEKPENRVELRLAVNAGSLCETEDERGLAHFSEHMCFNGTKNFEKNELINVLEKMGMKFGGDVNAYTSFAETVYMLQVPTDDPTLIDQGFQIIEDWAHNVTFAGEEIDKERGVIISERRMGLGADDRMMKKSFPIIFKGSMFAERIPIGTLEVLESFKHETIRNFYKKWYRPNLQAVVVVGDIDVDKMEEKIKKHFGSIQNPVNAPEMAVYDLPDNDEPLIAIASDAEATSNSVYFFYKHPRKETKTVNDFRQGILEELYNGMMNERLRELSLKTECPYIMAYSSYGPFLARPKDAFSSFGMMKENKILEGIEAIMTENLRAKKHGFTATELDRQKKDLVKNYEKAAKEFDKTRSASLAGAYVSNFLNKSPIPGARYEFDIVSKLIDRINLDEINQLPTNWVTEKNLVVMVSAPEKEGVIVPNEQDILAVIKKVKGAEVEPWIDNVSDAPLLADVPAGTKISHRKENVELGFTELTLANGVQVVIKTTDFKNNEILISAFSPGGHSLANDEDFISANFSSKVIDLCGISEFDASQLEKKLKGKDLSITPVISDLQEGFSGKAAPESFETLLQLIYLYFTNPRQDQEAFDAFISKTKNQLKFFGASPQMAWSDTLMKTITGNNPRAIVIPKVEQIEKIKLQTAYDVFKDRFADASDFKFFIVGNVDMEKIVPLLETYLGGLPSRGRKETWKDHSKDFPSGVTEITVKKGMEEKSMVAIVMKDDFEWNYTNRLHLSMMTDILNIRLRENMREDQGGVYGVQIMQEANKFPKPNYQLIVAFGCGPKDVKKLVKTVFEEMEILRTTGPRAEDLDKIKENLKRDRETDLKENNFWINELEIGYLYGDDFSKFNKYLQDVMNVTADDIKNAAKKYITPDHYVKAILIPEKKAKK